MRLRFNGVLGCESSAGCLGDIVSGDGLTSEGDLYIRLINMLSGGISYIETYSGVCSGACICSKAGIGLMVGSNMI